MSFGNGFELSMPVAQLVAIMLRGLGETLYMTVGSTLFAYILGLPMGVILVTCAPDGLMPDRFLYRLLYESFNTITNVVRSVPFLILLIFIIPFTRAIVGTSLGMNATVVPLVISAAPMIARMVESSLKEVDGGVIEAAVSMGASNGMIIRRVMIKEALPSLIDGVAISMTTILGYSAMAGATGGGGLGSIAINYGYLRYQKDIMFITIVLLIIVVQIFQWLGSRISRGVDRRRR